MIWRNYKPSNLRMWFTFCSLSWKKNRGANITLATWECFTKAFLEQFFWESWWRLKFRSLLIWHNIQWNTKSIEKHSLNSPRMPCTWLAINGNKWVSLCFGFPNWWRNNTGMLCCSMKLISLHYELCSPGWIE